ncbi:hypothetical protein [Shewanella woodyi]|nr:hypothetical protein [Shewanella woodyi]
MPRLKPPFLSIAILTCCAATVSPKLIASSVESMTLALLADVEVLDTGSSQVHSPKEKSFSALNSNPFIGSWQLLSGRYLDETGAWSDYQSLHLNAIKVISDSHFSFTTVKETSEQGVNKLEFWAAGTGRYEYNDSQYIEYPTLNSFGAKEGASFAFEYEVKGDKLHTKRVEAGKLKEVEVWRKLD